MYQAQIDKCFGFDTAVEQAQEALLAAKVEAGSAYHGIGVVKLMGRSSGFIAMQASLASGAPACLRTAGGKPHQWGSTMCGCAWNMGQSMWCGVTAVRCVPAGVVDVCLIPEVKFDLQGDRGLLKFVQGLLDEKGHCVVCIAEGAGQVCVLLWTCLALYWASKGVRRQLAKAVHLLHGSCCLKQGGSIEHSC